ncbi:MAG: hypothetical protein H7124_02630 [Phycisphaerales bacterium]|nr:hypothetical protein [Hyphomonadaceae bacterium]
MKARRKSGARLNVHSLLLATGESPSKAAKGDVGAFGIDPGDARAVN